MVRYRFADEIFECNETSCPSWKKTFTVYGACCSFNYHPTSNFNSKSKSVNLNQIGQMSGLSIVFSTKNLPESGLSLIITRPGGYVMHYNSFFALNPRFDNFFQLYVQSYRSHSNFERLPFDIRRCLLPKNVDDEREKSQSWCALYYTLETIYKECDCHPYYMPNVTKQSASIRNCTVKDLFCFKQNEGIMTITTKYQY